MEDWKPFSNQFDMISLVLDWYTVERTFGSLSDFPAAGQTRGICRICNLEVTSNYDSYASTAGRPACEAPLSIPK